jgi:hypothetical protein
MPPRSPTSCVAASSPSIQPMRNMTNAPSLRLLAPVAAVLRNPAAHGYPDLPAIRRYRVRFEGYQRQADLIGGELYAETGSRRKALDQNLTNRLLSLPVTDSDSRVMTNGELLYEAAETLLDHRHPEWTAAEGTFGVIDFRFVPRLRITGTITRRRITLLTSRL